MTQIMTPSKSTTAGQIDKAVALYRALLEKHSRDFNAEIVQAVLGQPELVHEQFAVFRRRAESSSHLIVRTVSVNRTRTPKEALDATGRRQVFNCTVVDAIVDTMPRGQGDEVEVVFFKPDLSKHDGYISDDELEKEYELRGLKPADPISVAAVNEEDSTFADKIPNGTHWKGGNGNWSFIVFQSGGLRVQVDQRDVDWNDAWWFAGLRK